jgi:transcriptional regulator with XRE-family HTH domain
MATAIDALLAEANARRTLPPVEVRRLLRRRLGISQQELADALGVSRPALSRWESGQRSPRGKSRGEYADALQRLAREEVVPND